MRNSGRPWPSWVVMVTNQSGPLPALKFATVAGSSSSDEAKIGGITPEGLSLSGRWGGCPPNILFPTWRFGYWVRNLRCARSLETMKAVTGAGITITVRDQPVG